MQEIRRVKSLVIALIASITAAIAAVVEAPAELVTISAVFSAAVIGARILRTRMRAEKRSGDLNASTNSLDPEKQDQEVVRDSSMLRSKLQVESMRASALAAELSEMKKRHDELLQERVELLRKSELSSSTESSQKPITIPEARIDYLAKDRDEQREKLVAALAASESASRTFKDELKNMNRKIAAISDSLSSPPNTAEDAESSLKAAYDAIAAAKNSISKVSRENTTNQRKGAKLDGTQATESLVTKLTERVASVARQLNDATDIMRLTAMNFKLASERNPVPAGAVDSHQATASGIESLGESLLGTSSEIASLTKDIEQAIDIIDRLAADAADHNANTAAARFNLPDIFCEIDGFLNTATTEITNTIEGLRSNAQATSARERLGHQAIAEATARFAAATGWADSATTGLKTLLQGAELPDEPR